MTIGLKKTASGFEYRGVPVFVGDGVIYDSPTGYKRGRVVRWWNRLGLWVRIGESHVLQRVRWIDVVDVFQERVK